MRNFLIFLLTIQLVRCLNSEDNNSVLFRNNNVDIDEGVANGGMGGAGGDGGDAINTTGKAGNGGRGGNGGSGGEVVAGGNGGGNGKGGNGRAVWWSSSPSPKGSRTNQTGKYPAYKPAKYGSKSTQHPHPSQPSQPPKKPNDKPNKRPKPGKHQEEPPTGVPRDCLEGIPDDPPAQLQCELDALAERDQLDTKPTYPWSSTKKPGLIAVMKPGKIPNDQKPKNPTPTPTQTPTPSAKPSKGKDKGKGKGKGKTAAHSTTVTEHSTTGRPSTSDSFDEILEILNRPQLKPAKPQKKPNEKPKDKPQDQSHDKPHDRPQEKPQEIHQNKPQVDGQDSLPGLKPSIDRPWLKPAVKPLPHTDLDLESPMKPVFKPMKPHIPFLWPRPREELEEPSEDENAVETSVEDKVSEGVVLKVGPFFA